MRLGILSYINSLPVTMALEKGLLPGEEVEVVIAPPAELNELVERWRVGLHRYVFGSLPEAGIIASKDPGILHLQRRSGSECVPV